MLELTVNGNRTQVPEHVKTISDVKQHFHIENQAMIVEHNGEILDKSAHTEQEVADGDKVELVQFVGGG
ncbi:hypothetical protein GCM10008983_00570 [Lentibacillus halophilus]|uniref:Sulfur carrier protein n=1 Tax=Lentibacillus halophilus TaxID=295065 RepID=A0ABN0Z1K0_9BACI